MHLCISLYFSLSLYPSLSVYICAQGEADDDVISSTSSDEEEEIEEGITEEERIERALDKKNMKLEFKAKGDGENYPVR